MQKNPSRRLRRNIDVMYTGQKESRSHSKAANLSGLLKPTNETSYITAQIPQNIIFNGQKPQQVSRNEQLNKKMTHHSHSQHLLDPNPAIQHKIYNQQQALMKQNLGTSPNTQIAKNKHPNLSEYPSHTPLTYQTLAGPSSTTDNYFESLSHLGPQKDQRSLTNLNKLIPGESTYQTRNVSQLTNSRSGLVLKNQQTLGAILNNTVYKQIQIKDQSPMKLGNAKKKQQKQGTQALSLQQQLQHIHQIQQYGQAPIPKQYSGKQMNSTMGNLSIGSQGGHQHAQAMSILHQTNTFGQTKGTQSGMQTQPIHQLQTISTMEGVMATNNPTENINFQGYQTNSQLLKKDAIQQLEFRNYKVVTVPRNGSLDENQVKSRNASTLQTTNGTGHNNPNGAILNINTASDINIYNNSFIVKTSQNKTQQEKITSRSQGKRNQKNTSTGKNSQKQQSNERQMNNSVINNFALNVPNIAEYPRSLSQGRPKPVQGASTFPNSNFSSQVIKTELPKAQQIAEAYNQAQQTPVISQPQQLQSWRSNQISNKMLNSKGFSNNFASNEKSKMRVESNDATESKPQLKKNFIAQYNNLLESNPEQQAALKQLRKSGINRQAYKHQQRKESMGSSLAMSRQTLDRENSQTASQINLAEGESGPKRKEDRVRELIIQGRRKIQAKEYTEAIKLFTIVLEQHEPKNQKAFFFRALSYLDQGNLQQAINEFWQVVSLFSDYKVSQVQADQVKLNTNVRNSRDKEMQLCQQAYILLSIAHKRLNEGQNAIEDLDKCLKLFPDYPEALLARGQTLLTSGNYAKAHEDLKRYNMLQNDSFIGQLALGDCLQSMKNFSEAIEAFTAAILLIDSQKQKPNFKQLKVQCYMKRALASFYGSQFLQALSDFQTVVKEDPSEVKAHFYIGKLLSKGIENQVSKREEAILHFEQCAKYPEKEFYAGNALFQIAKLRLRNKDYYEAYFSLKRASDNKFTSKRMQMYKDFTEGVLYLIKRKIKKGVQILTDLLEMLINKEKELAKQQKNEKLNKKLIDPKGENEDPKAKALRDKQQASEKAHRDYLIQQIYIFREYGYVAIEKYELAQDDIKRIKRYGKPDMATIYNKYLGKGILRMDHEDYLMASKYFTKAWKKFPQNKDPYCLQVISIVRSYSFSLAGYSIDQQIKFEKVLQTKRFMDKAIRNCNMRQKEPSLYFFRGLLNFHLHRFYDALQDFNVAVEEEEESTAYFFLARGRTYACLSILTEAMKDLSVALNLDEALQQGYIYRGKCAYLLGDNNLAFLDFQRLILSDPKNPMVHIYAGNLLMTTGAYSDAIKAYENADTVEPTAVSAFQRVRCYCAMSDLEQARNMMSVARQAQPDDVILQFDNMCLDQLYMVTQVTRQLNNQARTAADIKHADKVLKNSMQILNMLIKTYESDKLTRLKRKDSCLNIQLIPNIERIKIEKNAVARDFFELKRQNPDGDYPTLDYNPSQKIDFNALKTLENVSYYFENIFGIEDFYLYRAVISFYQQEYKAAIQDFKEAQKAHHALSKPDSKVNNDTNESFFNGQNHSLRLYTDQSLQSFHSAKTDLSDVGLCSFNVNESVFNLLICYIFVDDKQNALQMMNDLTKTLPKKYATQLSLLRALIYDHFGSPDKAQAELKKFKASDSRAFEQLFGLKSNRSNQKQVFTIELFPSTDRLCNQFEPVVIPIATKGLGAGITFKTRLSFSTPFIKPPNMIPNVDEETVHNEFNLKQIDAPMPEAPWIKRCKHGVNFTSQVQLETITDTKQQQKYKQFFETRKDDKKKPIQAKPRQEILISGNAAGTRLLDQIQEESVSDKQNNSLMDDSRILDEECGEKNCESNYWHEALKLPVRSGAVSTNVVASVAQSNLSEDNDYDSEVDVEDSEDDFRKIISAHDELLLLDRDSVVNFGTNVVHELKKQKKIKQHVQNMIAQGQNPAQLLPNAEEAKALQEKSKRDRYTENLGEDEKLDSLDFQSTGLFRSRVVMPKKDPIGLDHNMLIGHQAKKKKRERHISNLSISRASSDAEEKKGQESARSSMFRQKISE